MAGGNPALLTLEKPKFSGARADWSQFQTRWERYLAAIQEDSPMGDYTLLEMLRGSLDEVTAKDLDGKREVNPDLEYLEYWEGLKIELGGTLRLPIGRHGRQ